MVFSRSMQTLVAFSSLYVPTIKQGSNVSARRSQRLLHVFIVSYKVCMPLGSLTHNTLICLLMHFPSALIRIPQYNSFTIPQRHETTLPDSHPALTLVPISSCDWVPPITFTNVAEYEYTQRCVFYIDCVHTDTQSILRNSEGKAGI